MAVASSLGQATPAGTLLPPQKKFPGEVRGYQEPSGARQTGQDSPPGLNRQEQDSPPGLNRQEQDSPPGLETQDKTVPQEQEALLG